MLPNLIEESNNKSIMTFFDVILTLWIFTMAFYLRSHSRALLAGAWGITCLYILFHVNKKGFFSQKVQSIIQKIDIATFPFIDKHPNFPKALINIIFMVSLLVITYSLDMLAIFFFASGLYVLLFIAFLQTKSVRISNFKRVSASPKLA